MLIEDGTSVSSSVRNVTDVQTDRSASNADAL